MEKKGGKTNILESYFQRSQTVASSAYEQPSSTELDTRPVQYGRRNRPPKAERCSGEHPSQDSVEDQSALKGMASGREDSELQSDVDTQDGFEPYALSTKSPITSNIKAWAKILAPSKFQPAKRVRGQYFLELGQTDFTHTTCKGCGLVYARGHDEDEKVHDTFHQRQMQGIGFQGWKRERVVATLPPKGSRILIVLPGDPPQHVSKAKDVLSLAERELGLSPNWAWNPQCKVFMYISASKVLGCLVAENIKQAFRILPKPGVDLDTPTSGLSAICSRPSDSSASANAILERGSVAPLCLDSARGALNSAVRESPGLVRCSAMASMHTGCDSAGVRKHEGVMESALEVPDSASEATGGGTIQSTHKLSEGRSKDEASRIGGSGAGSSQSKSILFGGYTFQRESVQPQDSREGRISVRPSGAVRCESQAVPAVCGVRLVWVWPRERRKGIAVRLLDAMRHHFTFGYIIPPAEIAFAQPTAAGVSLAESYCKHQTFFVY